MFLSVFACSVSGQEHAILSKFTAQYTGNEVVLAWTIKGGEQCNGVDVYRSIDSVNWVKIGGVEGICGASEPQFYDFIDADPEQGNLNYYKLQLGTQGFSSIQKVKVIRYDNLYAAYPNPSSSFINLSFTPEIGNGELLIFDLHGKQVYSKSLDSGEEIFLDKDQFGTGFFFFRWLAEGKTVSGKLIFE
jgi:hypothetical protein